ncbi:MAG: hypothetical protein L3J57_12555 [Desulfuromusa sp.]|nr:hypothetical protein [Desulfuromusa sp.]
MGATKKTDQTVNKLGRKCIRTWRQDESVLLVDCPRFLPRPFKSEKLTFTQLDLFGSSAEPEQE